VEAPQDPKVTNKGLKMAMEALVLKMRPVLHGGQDSLPDLTSFWIMVLHDLGETSSLIETPLHDESDIITRRLSDLNPHRHSDGPPTDTFSSQSRRLQGDVIGHVFSHA
jgi:hypothetical protein